MKIWLMAGMILAAGTAARAQEKAGDEAPATAPEVEVAAAAPVEESKLARLLDREKADVQAFVDRTKADLDALAEREKGRLDALVKRIKAEAWGPAEKGKVKSLQDLMKNSALDLREKALKDLKDDLRTTKLKTLWTKYKTDRRERWAKFKQNWQKVLSSPPLVQR